LGWRAILAKKKSKRMSQKKPINRRIVLASGRYKHCHISEEPEAFIGLLTGKNFGKLIVQVAQD
jgi:NADPH-dependent curcumin reductase CurA